MQKSGHILIFLESYVKRFHYGVHNIKILFQPIPIRLHVFSLFNDVIIIGLIKTIIWLDNKHLCNCQ
jgi:hypothetical protein